MSFAFALLVISFADGISRSIAPVYACAFLAIFYLSQTRSPVLLYKHTHTHSNIASDTPMFTEARRVECAGDLARSSRRRPRVTLSREKHKNRSHTLWRRQVVRTQSGAWLTVSVSDVCKRKVQDRYNYDVRRIVRFRVKISAAMLLNHRYEIRQRGVGEGGAEGRG